MAHGVAPGAPALLPMPALPRDAASAAAMQSAREVAAVAAAGARPTAAAAPAAVEPSRGGEAEARLGGLVELELELAPAPKDAAANGGAAAPREPKSARDMVSMLRARWCVFLVGGERRSTEETKNRRTHETTKRRRTVARSARSQCNGGPSSTVTMQPQARSVRHPSSGRREPQGRILEGSILVEPHWRRG
jgi:hypothetical protein